MSLNTDRSKNPSQTWCFVLVLVSALLAVTAGFFALWTDSEMWPVAATKYMFWHRPEYYFGTKPFFHLLLNLNQHLAQSLEVIPMDTARLFMTLNSAGILIAVFVILRRLAGVDQALAGTAFLIGLSFFVKRAGGVRSDLIATHLALWAIWFQVSGHWARHRVALMAAPAAMLITPKAAFWILCLLPVFRPHRLIWLGGGLFTFLVLNGHRLWPGHFRFVTDPLEFFVHSFDLHQARLAYFDVARFRYVTALIIENPQLVAGLLLVAWMMWRRKPAQGLWAVRFAQAAGLFALLLAFYPDRLPFMITALLPFFVLPVFSLKPTGEFKTRWRNAVVGGSFLMASFWSIDALYSHNNILQRSVAIWLQFETDKYPEIEIFDPAGVLPGTTAHYWFVGPGQTEKNQYVVHQIAELKPEIIIFASKFEFMRPHIDKVLVEDYEANKNGLFVRKAEILSPGRDLDLHLLYAKLSEQFPRLVRQKRPWILWLTGERGERTRITLSPEVLQKADKLALPAHTVKVTVLPFELEAPFDFSLFQLFRFDITF